MGGKPHNLNHDTLMDFVLRFRSPLSSVLKNHERGGPYQQIKVYSRGQELKWNRIEHQQLGIGPLMHQIYVILVKKTQREVTQCNYNVFSFSYPE
jgi:hypothetical protein